MKIKSLTKEQGEYVEGSTVELKGGAPEFLSYLADEIPWPHLLQGMADYGIERQVFSTSIPGFNIRLIVAPKSTIG